MDRFDENLALAKDHVAEATRHVFRQKQIIAELERDGHSTKSAKELLRLFEKTLEMHIEHRDQLRRRSDENDSGMVSRDSDPVQRG